MDDLHALKDEINAECLECLHGVSGIRWASTEHMGQCFGQRRTSQLKVITVKERSTTSKIILVLLVMQRAALYKGELRNKSGAVSSS